MTHFFSLARNSKLHKITKGTMPATEFYGAFRPEYSPGGAFTNKELLDEIADYGKIIVAGEAMDYCVYETVKQMLEWLSVKSKAPDVFVLSDCTSSIQPRETAEALYAELAGKYKFKLVRSTEKFL
jgi:nicotinamidase-related amidase